MYNINITLYFSAGSIIYKVLYSNIFYYDRTKFKLANLIEK